MTFVSNGVTTGVTNDRTSATSRLHIALIAHNRFPIRQPFAGGLEAHVWHLARALADEGHRVTLFADADSDLDSPDPGLTITPLPRTAAAARPFPLPGAVKESDHRAFLDLMRHLVDQSAHDVDVIHNHCLHHVPIHLAPRLRIPMLTTFHTPPLPWLESAIGATGGAGSAFAAVSGFTADTWRHVVPDQLHVVPNGVDPSRWPAGPGGDHLVWSGRLTPRRARTSRLRRRRWPGVAWYWPARSATRITFASSSHPSWANASVTQDISINKSWRRWLAAPRPPW